ncbi:MAG: hypothetical protein JNL92_25240 [Opitutaceae bacterium]|nr:hypothetical protein [Opitutaceae bacterium]
MSASKKTTTKSTKSPAPATKPAAKKAPATTKVKAVPVAAPAPAPVAKAAPAPAPVVKAAAVTKAAPVALPAVKPVASSPVVTTISARIDIGFGNTLYLRGEGPGLSWDRGVAMECVADDLWRITLAESARAYTFKFLVNDLSWSVGPDYSVACGASVTLTPEF